MCSRPLTVIGIYWIISADLKDTDMYCSQLEQVGIAPRLLHFVVNDSTDPSLRSYSLLSLSYLVQLPSIDKLVHESTLLEKVFKLWDTYNRNPDECPIKIRHVLKSLRAIAQHSTALLREKLCETTVTELFPRLHSMASLEHQGFVVGILNQLMQWTDFFTFCPRDSLFQEEIDILSRLKQLMVTSRTEMLVIECIQVTDCLVDNFARLQLVIQHTILRFLTKQYIVGTETMQAEITTFVQHMANQSCHLPSTKAALSFPQLVCFLVLSKHECIRTEAIWMLQLLSEDKIMLERLIQCPHLLGALELARSTIIRDQHMNGLINQMVELVEPVIHTYGSLLQLEDTEMNTCDMVSALATTKRLKEHGNEFFRLGDYFGARTIYRNALARIRLTEANKEREMNDKQVKLSIGSLVRVQIGSEWRNGMVSDVSDTIEVLYDDETEEEGIEMDRIRVRLSRQDFKQVEEIQIQLLMNMAKCCGKLHQLSDAIECLDDVIRMDGGKWDAFYLRGITQMELSHLKHAKDDLWRANQLERKNKHVQAAWKRLQALYSRKKRLDKKLMKDMLRYVSTIPGLDAI